MQGSRTVSSGTSFDSDIIPPMGHFIQQFSQPGTYEYYDSINPSAKKGESVLDLNMKKELTLTC